MRQVATLDTRRDTTQSSEQEQLRLTKLVVFMLIKILTISIFFAPSNLVSAALSGRCVHILSLRLDACRKHLLLHEVLLQKVFLLLWMQRIKARRNHNALQLLGGQCLLLHGEHLVLPNLLCDCRVLHQNLLLLLLNVESFRLKELLQDRSQSWILHLFVEKMDLLIMCHLRQNVRKVDPDLLLVCMHLVHLLLFGRVSLSELWLVLCCQGLLINNLRLLFRVQFLSSATCSLCHHLLPRHVFSLCQRVLLGYVTALGELPSRAITILDHLGNRHMVVLVRSAILSYLVMST